MADKKILVVDDDAINRKLLATMLSKRKGYQVEEASNGVEALEKVKEGDVALILLDLIMPIMDGITFLQSIKREVPQAANIPIVVLTTDDSKKEEAKMYGAKEVVIKPINPVEIMEKISTYLT